MPSWLNPSVPSQLACVKISLKKAWYDWGLHCQEWVWVQLWTELNWALQRVWWEATLPLREHQERLTVSPGAAQCSWWVHTLYHKDCYGESPLHGPCRGTEGVFCGLCTLCMSISQLALTISLVLGICSDTIWKWTNCCYFIAAQFQ